MSVSTRSKGGDVSGNNASSIMDKLIEIENKMDTKLDRLADKFDEKLDKLRRELKADIKDELLPKISKNEKDIKNNTMEIRETKELVQEVEHSLELMWKSSDLIVRGVPVLANENVVSLYQTIAVLIGYDAATTPRARIQRLGQNQPKSKYEPPILISFICRFDKADFYRKYFANVKKLTLTALGFHSSARFYLSENLTKRNQKIFSEALKLKKAKKLYSVSTSSGTIWVRQKSSESATSIKDMSGLVVYESEGDD
jgi:hypothetical protein